MSKRSVAPLLIGTFLLRTNSGAGTVVIGLFLAHLSAHLGHAITSVQVGLLAVVYFTTELLLSPIMGALSDRWGRRRFLVIGPILGLTVVTLFLFTPLDQPLPYLISLQILSGLASSMQVPAVLSYLADFTVDNPSRRMRVMSFYELATSGGIAAGVVVGGFAWDRFERFAFAVLALIYVAVVICMFLTPPTKQVIEHGSVRVLVTRYWRIIRSPRLFIFIPAWICIFALLGIWLSSQLTFLLATPAHDHNQLLMGSMSGHDGGRRVSFVLGAFVLFFGLCLLFWAFFLNRVPRIVLMLTSMGGVYLACLALTGINHRGLGNDYLLFIWIPVLLLGVFAETSFAPAALAYLADLSEEVARDRGLLMGLYSVFLGLGQLLGNGLGGFFAHLWGFDGLIYLTILLTSIALICLLILFRHERGTLYLYKKATGQFRT
jgi:MFS family permease